MKQVKRDSAHAPGVAVAHGIAIDLGRMQMQEDVGQHAQRAIARRVVVLVAEDRSENLSLGRVLEKIDLLLGFGRHVGLERLHIFLDLRTSPFQQAGGLPVFAVLSVQAFPSAIFRLFSAASVCWRSGKFALTSVHSSSELMSARTLPDH
jgi:hypothetical protein